MAFLKLLSSKPLPLNRAAPLQRGLNRLLSALPAAVTLFLLLVAAVSLVGPVFGALPAGLNRFLESLSSFSAVFLGIFVEAVPYLLLGTLAAGLVEVFVDREALLRWFPRQPVLAVLAGALVGLFFPVCECGVVPFARRLMHKGLPVSVGVATLLAAPVLNPIAIASTLAAFGPGPVLWGRLGLTLFIATSVGLVFMARTRLQTDLRVEPALRPENIVHAHPARQPADDRPPVTVMPLASAGPPSAPQSRMARLRQALLIAVDEFFEMGRYLVLGALLAALMQTVVRQPALLALGQGPVSSPLVMSALAYLLSICSTVDAFIALAFAGTFPLGSLLAFLVFGPMVDIKSTLMFLKVFRPRVVAWLVLLPLALTLAAATLINLLGWGGVTP